MTARRLAAGCGVAVFVALLVGGCGLAALYAQLPAGEHPDVDFEAEEISTARAAKASELERELDGVERRFDAPRVGQRGRVDRCEAGQDNFTRQDRYAYACRMLVVQLLPLRAQTGDDVSRLGEALLPGTCPEGTETDRELADNAGDPELLLWASGDCTSGSSSGGAEIVTVVPAPPTAAAASSVETFLRSSCETASIHRAHCAANPIDLGAAAAAAPSGTRWLAVLAATDAYYLIPWECDWPASWFKDSCRGPAVVR